MSGLNASDMGFMQGVLAQILPLERAGWNAASIFNGK